jgi:hypothetical protein
MLYESGMNWRSVPFSLTSPGDGPPLLACIVVILSERSGPPPHPPPPEEWSPSEHAPWWFYQTRVCPSATLIPWRWPVNHSSSAVIPSMYPSSSTDPCWPFNSSSMSHAPPIPRKIFLTNGIVYFLNTVHLITVDWKNVFCFEEYWKGGLWK